MHNGRYGTHADTPSVSHRHAYTDIHPYSPAHADSIPGADAFPDSHADATAVSYA
jgi:hypothetical protein